MSSVYDVEDAIPDPPAPIVEKKKRGRKREDFQLSPTETAIYQGKINDLVDVALQTIKECMEKGDLQSAAKSAFGILDRAGFGPKSTVDINAHVTDLSNFTKEQLAERASRISALLKGATDAVVVNPTDQKQLAS